MIDSLSLLLQICYHYLMVISWEICKANQILTKIEPATADDSQPAGPATTVPAAKSTTQLIRLRYSGHRRHHYSSIRAVGHVLLTFPSTRDRTQQPSLHLFPLQPPILPPLQPDCITESATKGCITGTRRHGSFPDSPGKLIPTG